MNLVILAAGESKRFGENKLLADINGEILYKHMEKIYENAYNFKNKIIVGRDIHILEYYRSKGFIDIINNKPELGKSRSIKLAIKALEGIGCLDSVMFGVCDQPLLSSKTVNKIINEFRNSDKSICSVRYKDRLGNPCIFSSKWFDELLSLGEDEGGKKLIRNHVDETLFVDIEVEDELLDIDTKELYYYILDKIHKNNEKI